MRRIFYGISGRLVSIIEGFIIFRPLLSLSLFPIMVSDSKVDAYRHSDESPSSLLMLLSKAYEDCGLSCCSDDLERKQTLSIPADEGIQFVAVWAG